MLISRYQSHLVQIFFSVAFVGTGAYRTGNDADTTLASHAASGKRLDRRVLDRVAAVRV